MGALEYGSIREVRIPKTPRFVAMKIQKSAQHYTVRGGPLTRDVDSPGFSLAVVLPGPALFDEKLALNVLCGRALLTVIER